MERKTELSRLTKAILELIIIGVVGSIAIAIILVIFTGVAGWYNALF